MNLKGRALDSLVLSFSPLPPVQLFLLVCEGGKGGAKGMRGAPSPATALPCGVTLRSLVVVWVSHVVYDE